MSPTERVWSTLLQLRNRGNVDGGEASSLFKDFFLFDKDSAL